MIRKKDEYQPESRQVAGGVGNLMFRNKFTKEELYGKCRLCAELILQPGESIGRHRHENEFELFYLLSGELVSIGEDGGEEPFCVGDMMLTGGGDSHSLRNDGNVPATMLAVIVT